MQNNAKLERLLECLIHVIGRATIPQSEVIKIVGNGPKQVKAFNLCDGRNSQKEIAQKTGLDPASLSRTSVRWVEAGAAFWIGEGKDARLLHVYPLPQTKSDKLRKTRRRKTSRKA